jgi:hypothetical protein
MHMFAIELPPVAAPQWTQDQAISFEAARECLSDVIAICIARIADEETKSVPDVVRLTSLEDELASLIAKRQALRLADAESVANVRAVYGAQVRAYREKHIHSA